jgi:ABC-type proline/glycine betaine transport system permease subunit
MFIFLATVPFVFFDSANAVDSVPDTYLDTAYTLGARFTPLRGLQWAALIAVAYGLLLGLAHVAMEGFPSVAEADGELAASWKWGLAKAVGMGLVLGFVLWFPIVGFQAIRKVLFALALPDIMNSLRLLFGLAFGYIMLAEVINAQHGLGAIINTSQRQGPREHIYLVLIIIAILAYGIDRALLWAHGRLFPYRTTGEK